jgi:hypothetical protein
VINGCEPSYMPVPGELDFDKLTRKSGSAVDIGAYESIPASLLNSTMVSKKLSYVKKTKVNIASKTSSYICVENRVTLPVLLNGKTVLFQR